MTEAIYSEISDDQVWTITFDQPGSSANVLNKELLKLLANILENAGGDKQCRGVIFRSAKPSIFIAGADIKQLSASDSDDHIEAIAKAGQDTFGRIAALNVPTVAAIHGACLGGGYELCLACDYRLATDDRSTRIGLPETSLGIVPAWGGCTRLPRLIGLPRALDIILGGRRLPAQSAVRRGMVDEVVPKEHLMQAANRAIRRQLPKRKNFALLNNPLASSIIASRAREQTLAKTHGNYPAIKRALEVVTGGLRGSVNDALRLEREAIVELARTSECHSLIGLFFLQERSKKLRILSDTKYEPVGNAAVVGAGVMGAGIAQWLSSRGHHVILRDISVEQLQKGMKSISGVYRNGVKRRVFSRVTARQGLDRVSPSVAAVPLHRADLVIEAAAEIMDIKLKIFSELGELARDDTILATNTSALSLEKIAEAVPVPERVIGLHFFNPVHRMQLVEIVTAKKTAPEITERAVRFVQSIGKMPVVVKDSPGFVVNRILMPYLIEASALFERGATADDIDRAMLKFGMPMGPLRLLDEVGVDVAQHVGRYLGSCFPGSMAMSTLLEGMVEAGMLGRKTGSGYYVYSGKKTSENDRLQRMKKPDRAAGFDQKDLEERMILLMINEGARCIEESVVDDPRDIDFAMVMGTGFAPFRGGLLRYADAIGMKRIVTGMNHLAENEDARFTPCDLLVSMLENDQKFYTE
jgi:3-hydroxyacyl-CoA dehydrogenase/enoyl-CoA hydratase/3-hydroxybutyryl-CoA epimerase